MAAKKFTPDRMYYRQFVAAIIFVFWVLDVCYKIFYIAIHKEDKHATKEEIVKVMRWRESFGMHCKLVKTPKALAENPNGKIEIQVLESLIFEIVTFLALSVFYVLTRRT